MLPPVAEFGERLTKGAAGELVRVAIVPQICDAAV
jgi:hypothetical protein